MLDLSQAVSITEDMLMVMRAREEIKATVRLIEAEFSPIQPTGLEITLAYGNKRRLETKKVVLTMERMDQAVASMDLTGKRKELVMMEAVRAILLAEIPSRWRT